MQAVQPQLVQLQIVPDNAHPVRWLARPQGGATGPQATDAICIAVTGYRHERDRKTAMEAGFQPGLVQPVDPAKRVELLAGVA